MSAQGLLPSPVCAQPSYESIEIVVAATGDLNGWLVREAVFPGEQRGLAHLAPVIARLRAKTPGLVLLDGGDVLAGSPEAARLDAQPAPAAPSIVAAMNALGYDAAVPGNRDLGLAPALRRAAFSASAFPWIAANVTRAGAAPPFRPYVVLTRGPPAHPVRIAVLGLTTPGVPMWVPADTRAGLAVGELEASAAHWLPRLRAEADLVIALVHSGLDGDYEREEAVANDLPLPNAAGRLADRTIAGDAFDLIVSASAHRLSPRDEGLPSPGDVTPDRAVPVVETGSRGDGLAVARFALRRANGRWRIEHAAVESHRAALAPDAALLDLTREVLDADRAWLEAPTAVRFRALPKRRQFFNCAGALQHAAVSSLTPRRPLHGGKGENGSPAPSSPNLAEGVVFSLLPMLWREHHPLRTELGRPVRRVHLFRWMPYEDRPVPARLSGRQIALLLEPYVRWRRGLVTSLGNVLHPGGLTPYWARLGGEATAIAIGDWPRPTRPPPGDAPLLDPHAVFTAWLSAFVATGGGGLAPQALLHPSQLSEEADVTLRELVFRYLSDPDAALPKACEHWLAK